MSRLTVVGAVAATSLALGALLVGPAQAAGTSQPAAGATQGSLTVVQALPGSAVGVAIDGRPVQSGASVGSVLGPYSLEAGSHSITFSDVDGRSVTEKVSVAAGGARDVVLHLPEAVDGQPEVNVYDTPTQSIGPDKSRVLVAHTANFGAADVAFDGTVVFDGVTNGQFAEADVPSGKHEVQLFPAGQDTSSVLGPLAVTLPAGTVTMTYAYGDPKDQSMKVVSHTSALSTTGTAAPQRIHTGSAGLASGLPTAFGLPGSEQAVPGWVVAASWLLALPILALLGLSAVRRVRGETVPALALAGRRRP